MSIFKSEYLLYIPASIASIIMALPLFSRLRARLAGTPPKTDGAITEQQATQDQEAVQKAIGDAVGAALNNEDFTKAVANHLAVQLQPSLKAALDISTLEKTLLASNEQLSRSLDETSSRAAGQHSELLTLTNANSTGTAGKISTLEETVSQITTSLADLSATLKAVQEQIASPDTSILTSHTTTLDKISTDLSVLQEQGPAPVVSAISSHSSKLDVIAADLAVVKENAETVAALKAISSELAAVKADIETGASANRNDASGATIQLGSVITALEAQTRTLSEIKSADASNEILAGVKTANESHATHTSSFSELKAATETTESSLVDLKTEVSSISGIVSEIKSSNLSPEILAAVKESGETQSALSTTVSDVKASNESYSAILTEIKSAVTAPAPISEKTDLTPLETSLNSIITTLDTQGGTLSEIKTAAESTDVSAALASQSSTLAEIKDSKAPSELLAGIEALKIDLGQSKTQIDKLNTEEILVEVKSVKSLIETIPTPPASKEDEILAKVESVKGLVEAIPAPKSVTVKDDEILTEIASVKTLIGAIPAPATVAVKDDEILEEVKSVKALVSAPTTSKDDEILEEVKSVKSLVGAPTTSKDDEILSEIKAVKTLVEKDTNVAQVGNNDKGVEVTAAKSVEANGTKVDAVEVEPSA